MARSRNLGHTLLANSVHTVHELLDKTRAILRKSERVRLGEISPLLPSFLSSFLCTLASANLHPSFQLSPKKYRTASQPAKCGLLLTERDLTSSSVFLTLIFRSTVSPSSLPRHESPRTQQEQAARCPLPVQPTRSQVHESLHCTPNLYANLFLRRSSAPRQESLARSPSILPNPMSVISRSRSLPLHSG